MSLFACYRLPHADHYIKMCQKHRAPLLLHSFSELEGREGFVVAPFQVSAEDPILLIQPDEDAEACAFRQVETTVPPLGRYCDFPDDYHHDFQAFHRQLALGHMSKIVLSRSARIDLAQASGHAFDLFLRACQRYPRMFVALVSMPGGDMWLTATPEVLLQGSGSCCQTMALAGTMRLSPYQLGGEGETVRWAPKDIEEQRYVASYIADSLKSLGIDYSEEEPRTVRAAHLVHLRSDFRFRLPADLPVSRLLTTLHPTPAVCGLPKQQALDFILQHEHSQRRYYSGFIGPLHQPDTRLYVTLRCIHISPCQLTLYAGGGLLRESREEQEWQETEAKLDTMRRLFI